MPLSPCVLHLHLTNVYAAVVDLWAWEQPLCTVIIRKSSLLCQVWFLLLILPRWPGIGDQVIRRQWRMKVFGRVYFLFPEE